LAPGILIPVTNAIERLHEEFKRRIKTQTVLPSAETAAMLFWALLASGQITSNCSRLLRRNLGVICNAIGRADPDAGEAPRYWAARGASPVPPAVDETPSRSLRSQGCG
jgi:hypothetical protein